MSFPENSEGWSPCMKCFKVLQTSLLRLMILEKTTSSMQVGNSTPHADTLADVSFSHSSLQAPSYCHLSATYSTNLPSFSTRGPHLTCHPVNLMFLSTSPFLCSSYHLPVVPYPTRSPRVSAWYPRSSVGGGGGNAFSSIVVI